MFPAVYSLRQKSGGSSATDHSTSNRANSSITDRSASQIRKNLPGYKLPTVQHHKDEKSYITDRSAPKKPRGLNYRPFNVKLGKRLYCRPFSIKNMKKTGTRVYITDRSASQGRTQLLLSTVQRQKDETSCIYIADRSASNRRKERYIYIYNIYIQHNHSNTYIYTRYILPTVQRKTGEQLHYRPFSARRVRRGHESDIERGSSSAR